MLGCYIKKISAMLVFVSIADKKILLVDVQTDSIRQR